MYLLSRNAGYTQLFLNIFITACAAPFLVLIIWSSGKYTVLAWFGAAGALSNFWMSHYFDIRIQGKYFVISNLYFGKKRIPVDQFCCIEEEEGPPIRWNYGMSGRGLKLRLLNGKSYRFGKTGWRGAEIDKGIRQYLATHA